MVNRFAILVGLAASMGACAVVLGIDPIAYVDPAGDGAPFESSTTDASVADALDALADVATDVSAPKDDAAACDAATPEHCGRCGHSCLGGACVDAACTPVPLAQASGILAGLAIHDDELFVTALQAEAVLRVAKDGGALVSAAAPMPDGGSAVHSPWGVAVDATHVYWANASVIEGSTARAPLDGGPSEVLLGGLQIPRGLVLTGDAVVVAEWNGFRIVRHDKGGPTGLWAHATDNASGHVAAQGAQVFWLEESGGVLGRITDDGGSPVRIPPVGTPPPGGDARGLVLTKTHVYWGTPTSNAHQAGIFRAARSSGVIERFATAEAYPTALAADTDALYWVGAEVLADGGKGTAGVVMTCAFSGGGACGASTRLSETASEPLAIAVDPVAVYWVERSGAVMRVAKP